MSMFDDKEGIHMYSTTVTIDEVAGEKVVTLPRADTYKKEVNMNDVD